MAKYLVTMVPGGHEVTISLDGFGPAPSEGATEVGSFEFDASTVDNQVNQPSDLNQGTTHAFVAEARRILTEAGATEQELKQITFIDKASNATNVDYDGITDAALNTNALPMTEGPDAGHPEASTQPGGVQSSVTGEHRPGHEAPASDRTTTPPATQVVQPEESNGDQGEQEGENQNQ